MKKILTLKRVKCLQACTRVSIVDQGYDLMVLEEAPRLRCCEEHHAIAVASVLCPVHSHVCLKAFDTMRRMRSTFQAYFARQQLCATTAGFRFAYAEAARAWPGSRFSGPFEGMTFVFCAFCCLENYLNRLQIKKYC